MATLGVLAIAFASGALATRYRLVSIREQIVEAVEHQLNTDLRVDAIELAGFRGIRLTGVAVHYEAAGGVLIHMEAPAIDAFFDLSDLLQGTAAVSHMHLEGARIRAERFTPDGPEDVDAAAMHDWMPPEWITGQSFRLTGDDCSLELWGWNEGPPIILRETNIDVYRLSGSSSIELSLDGTLEHEESKPLRAALSYTSPEQFRLDVALQEVTTRDIRAYRPGITELPEQGWANVHMRVDKYPNAPANWLVDATFAELQFDTPWAAGVVPEFGTVTAQGRYEVDARRLFISSALVDSDEVSGDIRGTVLIDGNDPNLDLNISIDQLPVYPILDRISKERMDQYGEFELDLEGMGRVVLTVHGPLSQPGVRASLGAGAGSLTFVPASSSWPAGSLEFGLMQAQWDSISNETIGAFHLTGGNVTHESGIQLDNLMGALSLDGTRLRGVGIQASLDDHKVVGSFDYDFALREAVGELSGTIANLEAMPFAALTHNLVLGGGVSFDIKGEYQNGTSRFSGMLDATQTEIAYDWFFLKPSGIGARAQFTTELIPGETIELSANLGALGSSGVTQNRWSHDGETWRLQHSAVTFDTLDISMVGRCLRLPYRVSGGGIATAGHYEWVRDEGAKPDGRTYWHSSGSCHVDQLTLAYPEAVRSMEAHDVDVRVAYRNAERNTGHLVLAADYAWMPPLGTPWFAATVVPEDMREEHEPTYREWTFELASANLEMPPWQGSDFEGEASISREQSELTSYRATIDEGWIEGSYRRNRNSDAYHSDLRWESIAAHYFLQHLDFPDVLSGNISGELAFESHPEQETGVKGDGAFTITDGQFSADFILAQLEQRMEGDISALPPSLRFSELSTDIAFDGSLVKTPDLRLISEGIELFADGQFEPQGEMEYDLTVSITPQTAEQIQVLGDYLNIRGHRLANQDIDLAFRMTGPTFSPKGELTQAPPVSVTLVTGGLGIVSDAVKVIDTPRKLLVDLLRIGGGLVTPQQRD